MCLFSRYQLPFKAKAVHWDCIWDVEEDSNLLKGIYEYGLGSWEAIKMDPSLQLHDKVSNYSVQRWIVRVMKALKHIRPLLRQVAITDI